MTTLREAAQQALEALKMMRDEYGEANCPACDHADAAVYALNDALAEPNRAQKMRDAGYTRRPTLREMAEPEYPPGQATTDVGVPVYVLKKAEPVQEPVKQCMAHGECFGGECIYTSPPQRKPLTKEEIHTLRLSIPATTPFLDAVVLYTRAVEAAHGIK